MNEPQPVRRVARLFGSVVQVIGLKLLSARDYRALFASVLRECPVRDVNPILRGGGGLGETSGTGGATLRNHRSNIADITPLLRIGLNSTALLCDGTKNTKCHWTCRDTKFSVRLSFYATSPENEAVISPNTTCLLNFNEMALCQRTKTENCNVTCDNFENNYCLYISTTFWGFVFLMSLGTVGIVTSFNINNAICFEILGKGEQMKYGKQRIWGEISYGLVGFLVGYIIDMWSQNKIYKTYTPAFLLAFIFISIDLICCKNLKLPRISRATNICADIYALSKYKSIIIFFCFAVIVGAIDGYIIFFLLWYEEDLAIKTGYMDKIKLIEGLTVAAEAFGCVIFLPLSGRILNKIGYGYTFNLSLVFYVLRLGLISIAPTPWWIVLIEFLLLGLSYTLSYVTTIAFADVISSSSVSVSVQGIMSGLKEGFATGAIFPFLSVYGKQLGISSLIMGSIGAILPILFMIAKPIFGFIMDYFQTQKKLIFMTLLTVSSSCYILIYFLPSSPGLIVLDQFQNVSCAYLPFCDTDSNFSTTLCEGTRNITCHWICKDANLSVPLSFQYAAGKEVIISPNTSCLININDTLLCQKEFKDNYNCNVICDNFENNHCLYTSITFWGFVLLMSLGSIGTSVSFTLTSAICFEILGKGEEMKYGRQHVWGDIGLGLAGFLTGYTIDVWSQGKIYKTYTSAFLLVFVFTCIDLICCKKLKLPLVSRSSNIFTDVYTLLKFKSTIIFLFFDIICGAFDGYMLSFMFWYEEDLAIKTGYMDKIKLIEGITIATEAFSCAIFMHLSGKILEKLGYGYTFTLFLVFYSLRLGLISIAPTPWWIIPIESLTIGPSYILCHVTSVAYANVISSSNVSVSIQGIISGMKDGFGRSIGSLVGSILLKKFGGALTLQIFSIFAAFCSLVYLLFYLIYLKHEIPGKKFTSTQNNIGWKKPDDARKHCVVAE
ncbi:MFSD6 protein, partial [Acromyrmex insinuator]